MRFGQSAEDKEAAAITRLVDDEPQGPTSSDAGTKADRPELSRQIDSERGVARELRAGGPEPPDRLISAIEAKVREAYGPRPARPRRRWLTGGAGWRPAIAAGALAAVCAAIVVLAVGGGGGTGPNIPAAANLAFAPSTGPAPAARSATLLDASYGGVTYPNYVRFAVSASGTRTDRIGGRPALTVFYHVPGGIRLSYTVFSGRAVPLPASARTVVYEGVPLKTFTTSSGLSVVTLVRYGRTCVLAAKTEATTVLALAAAPVLETRQA
jgi:hypothetical protein